MRKESIAVLVVLVAILHQTISITCRRQNNEKNVAKSFKICTGGETSCYRTSKMLGRFKLEVQGCGTCQSPDFPGQSYGAADCEQCSTDRCNEFVTAGEDFQCFSNTDTPNTAPTKKNCPNPDLDYKNNKCYLLSIDAASVTKCENGEGTMGCEFDCGPCKVPGENCITYDGKLSNKPKANEVQCFSNKDTPNMAPTKKTCPNTGKCNILSANAAAVAACQNGGDFTGCKFDCGPCLRDESNCKQCDGDACNAAKVKEGGNGNGNGNGNGKGDEKKDGKDEHDDKMPYEKECYHGGAAAAAASSLLVLLAAASCF